MNIDSARLPPKHPASSKIVWSAIAIAIANAVVAARPDIAAALPAKAVPIFDMVAGFAIAAFRLWSSGAPLQFGTSFRLGK